MRLIDADSLQKLFNATSTNLLRYPELRKDIEHMVRAFLMVAEMVSDAPTIDAEQVVRCKDCKNYWRSAGMCCYADMPINDSVRPEDYCSRGERREDG